uniref:NAD(P)-binding domain-containing protein n=1 Tax=Tetradesmus obliquus TaxID=3088 RepID=A0A383W3F2_TETOB|eukprot:jgi/Sobl393_1/18404/SZX71669.1
MQTFSYRQIASRTRVTCPGPRIAPHKVQHSRLAPPARADSAKEPSEKELQEKFFSAPNKQPGQPAPGSSKQEQQQQGNLLENPLVNPYALGRQARRAFDDVWEQLSSIAQPTKSYVFDEVLDPSLQLEEDPTAAGTKVLVVGATGRVGRILIRKLLLRGYKVCALIRRREGIRETAAEIEGLPSAVEIINGDVGELKDCQRAVKGVNKIIYCAAAKTAFTADLLRVEERGVAHMAAAMQDELFRRARAEGSKHSPYAKKEVADFGKIYHQLRWDIGFVGVQGEDGSISRDRERANLAAAEISEGNNLVFTGALFTRGAFAEVGAELNPLLPGGESRLAGTEGITMRVKTEGHTYACVLRTAEGHTYSARFPTRTARYSTVRLPWVLFRPEAEGLPPFDPAAVKSISLRYELRKPVPAATAAAAAAAAAAAPAAPLVPAGARLPTAPTGGAAPSAALQLQRQRLLAQQAAANTKFERFKMEVDWIKALPSGVEPEFILVSCSGAARPGLDATDVSRIVAAKRRGEDALRATGLGYTVMRPGPLVDEPGGYKALVFDQGDRVGQSVSAADVADICLRALHEPEARNKTFDVCYEYQPDEGLQLYELVASIPSSSGNYLAAALSTLQKNT